MLRGCASWWPSAGSVLRASAHGTISYGERLCIRAYHQEGLSSATNLRATIVLYVYMEIKIGILLGQTDCSAVQVKVLLQ
jgi:hypothetical protein